MTVAQIETVDEALAPGAFDTIIDVRSPSEFAEDHVPSAINLPALDDAERARVGTMYSRVSKFEAKKIGAALISRNIARHLEERLIDKPGGWRPLIYCWRGGQRSGAMAIVLGQIGWRVATLKGGYKAYRRHVSARLYAETPCVDAVLLNGMTGAGKTEILERLAARGQPVLDLEALAAHRGSVFGADPDNPQPSQKMFESRLLAAIDALPADQPVLVEAESSLIGERRIPASMWTAMQAAPVLTIAAPVEARAAYSERRYRDMAADPERAAALLDRLVHRHGRARVAEWRALLDAGEIRALIRDLLEAHYDPAYARSSARLGRAADAVIEVARLDARGLDGAAEAVEARLAGLRSGVRPG